MEGELNQEKYTIKNEEYFAWERFFFALETTLIQY